MDTILHLFETANTLTPMAIIGLLCGLLYVVLYKQPSTTHTDKIDKQISQLRNNDLHGLSEIVETLRRIEAQQTQAFATIIAKLNGQGR